MKRQRFRLLGLILISVLVLNIPSGRHSEALAKSDPAESISRVIMILVDMSGSTNRVRSTVYKEAFEKIFQKLGQ